MGVLVNNSYLSGVSCYVSKCLTVTGVALIVLVCLFAGKVDSDFYVCVMLACLGTGIFLLVAEVQDSAAGGTSGPSNVIARGMF